MSPQKRGTNKKVHNIKLRFGSWFLVRLTKIKTCKLKTIGNVEGLAHKKYNLSVDDNYTITAT